jgi:hypothetical protein
MSDRSKCKGCGQDVLWVKTDTGADMPLSIASKEKRFIVKAVANQPLIGTMVETFISHFADCPEAENFRKKAGGK